MVVLGLVVTVISSAALLLAHRRRRLRQAMEVLAQLDEERRARVSAERRLARVERDLRKATEQLEREDNDRLRTSEVEQVRAAVRRALPAGAGPVAVVSRGDDDLVRFEAHIGWHFPQTDEGVYAGHHPSDSDAAIRHLEEVRRRGARYLVIPASSAWWLDHYAGFRDHLSTVYQLTEPGNGVRALVDLTPTATDGFSGALTTVEVGQGSGKRPVSR